MAWFAISLILPALAVYALVVYCDREAHNDVATFCFRICLAIGTGVGLSSCTYFLWLFFVGVPGRSYHACELSVFAAVGLLGWALARASATVPQHAPHPSGAGTQYTFLIIAFVAALVLAAVGAIGAYWQVPLGDWDAWAIWNQRARFLFRAGDQWRQAFSPVFVHTDYPLLLPSSNVRWWSYLGAECEWTPWFLGCLFIFATVGMLTAGVCRLRSRSQGLLAGMALLGTIPFLHRGTLQYADVPLSFFILAAVASLVLYDTSERPHKGLLVLAGLLAGLAAWTKNEGWLFLIVLPVARGAVVWRRCGVRKVFGELCCWSAGVGPVLAVVVLQKACLAGDNEIVGGQGWEATLTRILDPSRYWYIVPTLVVAVLHLARPLVVVLPLWLLFLGPARNRPRGTRGLATAGAVPSLMLAGYFLVYLITPCDLHWHVNTSVDRLLLHLWPSGLWALFLWLATPEEVWAEESAASVPAAAGDDSADRLPGFLSHRRRLESPPTAVLGPASVPARPH
jgi:hypothetical protein